MTHSNVVGANHRVLICRHLSLPKRIPLFILASVCKSLQCLISALTQGGRGSHLFRLTCSACCGEGGALQTNIPGMCGARSQFPGHTVLPPLKACVPSRSTLLKLQVALQGKCLKRALGCVHFPGLSRSGSGSRVLPKGADLVGPGFCALPRSEQHRRPGTWQVHSPQLRRRVLSPPRS